MSVRPLRHNSEVVPERGEEEGWMMEDEVRRNKRLGLGGEERREKEEKRGKQFLFLLYSIQRIQRSLSALNMETEYSSRMFVPIYQTTRCHLT
jgi:hypothetical protein